LSKQILYCEICAVWPWLQNWRGRWDGVEIDSTSGYGRCLGRDRRTSPRVTPLVGLARQIIAARVDDAGDGPLFPSETGGVLTVGRCWNCTSVEAQSVADRFVSNSRFAPDCGDDDV
jgi:hypothetical protein